MYAVPQLSVLGIPECFHLKAAVSGSHARTCAPDRACGQSVGVLNAPWPQVPRGLLPLLSRPAVASSGLALQLPTVWRLPGVSSIVSSGESGVSDASSVSAVVVSSAVDGVTTSSVTGGQRRSIIIS